VEFLFRRFSADQSFEDRGGGSILCFIGLLRTSQGPLNDLGCNQGGCDGESLEQSHRFFGG
jgi:hypothetical protein